MTPSHATEVLNFWFHDANDPKPRFDLWFQKSDATDEKIKDLFESLVEQLASGHAHDWAANGPTTAAAAIIALDQFPRNIWRNTPKAFASDPLALSLAKNLVLLGQNKNLPPLIRWFIYLPYEHSENRDHQQTSVQLFKGLLNDAPKDLKDLFEGALDYAEQHSEVINRFDRFPHRNDILGRTSTPEEIAYLEEHGGF